MPSHYLAYGSNLHPARLRERVPSARLLGTVELAGRALRFGKRSVDGSAKCTIGPGGSSQSVHGAVYRIDQRHRQVLDRIEALGVGYAEQRETVTVADQVVDVFYYVATADYLDDSLYPYHWYKKLVLAGARYHGFPPQYIAALEEVESVDDPDPERRATNARLLERCVAESREPGLPASASDARVRQNLLADIPPGLTDEWFETLVKRHAVHIERIVSHGQVSPLTGWYDQDHREFVLLVKGAARLVFEGGSERALGPGDWLEIPAHQKHRVAWTDPDQQTVWLAVHYR